MEAIIYGIVFIIGTLFGSFFTLAVYRIPLGLDIVHEHSFCPNCNNKLKFRDLIPVVSYIMLGGKCRYCKQKIRIRYLLLEVLSGFTFLLFVLSLKLDISFINRKQIIYIVFYLLYISSIFIIAGIDKENLKIQRSLLYFALILSILFMIYVCISHQNAIYTYIILLCIVILLLILDTAYLKKKLSANYTISILILSLYMIIFTGAENYYYTVAVTLFIIALKMIKERIHNSSRRKAIVNNEEAKKINLPIGFYMCVSNIVILLISNFIN